MSRSSFFRFILPTLVMTIAFSGCTVVFQKGRRVDVEKISLLKSELSELERAKKELESRLSQEIEDKEVTVEMLEKGLTITFLAQVLFDSGKADLKPSSLEKVDKLYEVLRSIVVGLNVGIEGHTDNEPIKHSSWKTNWRLSSERALSVLHYLEYKGIASQRLSVLAFGEHRPVASNDAEEGRQQNRRVEVVILPRTTKEAADVIVE